MLKITNNSNVKNTERHHQLGDIVTDSTEQYLVIKDRNSNKFTLLCLSTMQTVVNEYETLEEMWEDNKDDVFLEAELIINN